MLKNAGWSRKRFRNGRGLGPAKQLHRCWIDPAFGGVISPPCSFFWWIDTGFSVDLPANTNLIENSLQLNLLRFIANLNGVSDTSHALFQTAGLVFSDSPGRNFIELRVIGTQWSSAINGVIQSTAVVAPLNLPAEEIEMFSVGFPWAFWVRKWIGTPPSPAQNYAQQVANNGPVACASIVVPSNPQDMSILAGPGVYWQVTSPGASFSPAIGMGAQSVAVTLTENIYGQTIPVTVSTTNGNPSSGGCGLISTGQCPIYATAPRAVVVGGNLTFGTSSYAPSGNLTSPAGMPDWNMPAAPSTGKWYVLGQSDCVNGSGWQTPGIGGELVNNGALAATFVMRNDVDGSPELPMNYLPQGTMIVSGSTPGGVTGTITLT